MSYLDRLHARMAEKGLPTEPTKLTQPGFVGFVGNLATHISPDKCAMPPEIDAGLLWLDRQPAPEITRPQVWPVIVADALMLAQQGWAGKALALGWHPLELFGCCADREGDDYLLGLAGWLDGRELDEVHDAGAIAIDRDQRAYFNRKRSIDGAIYLWEYLR